MGVQSMINVIGDSHSGLLVDSQNVRRFGLPQATTAHNLRRQEDFIRCLIESTPDEKWWFWFGEVDCRIHLDKARLMIPGMSNLKIPVMNTIKRYLEFLVSVHDKVGVFAVPPTGLGDPESPFFVKREMRQVITNHFNAFLEYYAPEYGIEYIDFLAEFRRPKFARPSVISNDYFEDPVHMKRELLVTAFDKWVESR
jgi:hypothetical protein